MPAEPSRICKAPAVPALGELLFVLMKTPRRRCAQRFVLYHGVVSLGFFLLWRWKKALRRCGSEVGSGRSHLSRSSVRSGSFQLRAGICPVTQRSDLIRKLRETQRRLISLPRETSVSCCLSPAV